jgi:hypothetical protein
MSLFTHIWEWMGHGEKYYFGDFNKPYCVDYWVCKICKKQVCIPGNKNPKPGKCQRKKN